MTAEAAEAIAQVELAFRCEDDIDHVDDRLREDISALAVAGRTLFCACDETASVERLVLEDNGTRFSNHRSIALGGWFNLPGGVEGEMDIEGLAVSEGYLWVSGSHSLKRRDSGEAGDPVATLKDMANDPNRSFLGRVPLVDRGAGIVDPVGRIEPLDGEGLDAACLPLDPKKNREGIKSYLSDDPLLRPFMDVPCKENGFDIEGLAVDGERILLGLRGPVVGTFALIVEVALKRTGKGHLKPRKLEDGRRYRLHALDLGGHGIRDLLIDEGRLLILSGPTADIDGRQVVHVLEDFARTLAGRVSADMLKPAFELPILADCDHAEGIAKLSRDGRDYLLVAFDNPAPGRRRGDYALAADLFPFP